MRRFVLLVVLVVFAVMAGCSQTPGASPNDSEEKKNTDTEQPSESDAESNNEPADEQSTIESFEWSEANVSSNSDETISNKGIVPTSISIPSINVQANVITVGKLANGKMESPEGIEEVGWYKFAAKPGEKGSAVMAGHVDSKVGPAVFYDLKELKEGDLIHVTNENGGEKLTFQVYKSKSYPKDEAPLNEVFGYSAAETLKLITCTGGEFLDDVGTMKTASSYQHTKLIKNEKTNVLFKDVCFLCFKDEIV
ncbi:secreted protein [Gracilibacillus boraciitolerans JCM 21714]|uniref:Secreted protein n=2 Tax=Gracilibacillus boraciitolerans TaxID=307521 RepID=W4VL36_9BACI|nr:secreted protein [Gracilibacillus boraciitolerans JCM 21714]